MYYVISNKEVYGEYETYTKACEVANRLHEFGDRAFILTCEVDTEDKQVIEQIQNHIKKLKINP